MKVNEIFRSVNGETYYSGYPTIFVRLTGCNLCCSFCDTTYARTEGKEMKPEEVFKKIEKLYKEGDMICFTGGEPLLQKEEMEEVISLLEEEGKVDMLEILVETNGSIDIGDRGKRRYMVAMDIKCPSSGMHHDMKFSNIKKLSYYDELKFVIGDREDYDYMIKIIKKFKNEINKILVPISIQPVSGRLELGKLWKWFLRTNWKKITKTDVRLTTQLQKIAFPDKERGV